MKGYRPIVPFEERIEIVRAISYVDAAVTDTSRDKRVVWQVTGSKLGQVAQCQYLNDDLTPRADGVVR